MKPDLKTAVLGGFLGALIAVALIYGSVIFGLLPLRSSDAAFHDYLMKHPDIVVAMTDKLQALQEANDETARQKAVDRIGLKAFFDPRFAFITGPVDAKRTLVEFFDYNCPYCRQSIPAMKNFYAAHKNDTRFAFIEFPIKGPQSTLAARAALAARKQGEKYVAFHFALMSEENLVDENTVLEDAKKSGLDIAKLKLDMLAPEISTGIAASHALADAAKIDGTPVFIVNGKIREGAVDDAELREMAKS